MIDPYQMTYINGALLALVIIGILAVKAVFKKKINFFTILLILLILPIISVLRGGSYESGDFTIHIVRSMAFYDSLKEGNLMPSWAPLHNAGYGLPLFIFNYTLPYYIIAFFHALGFSFIASLKIFLAVSFIFSGIAMYLLGNRIFRNDLAGFAAAIFYAFAPYHLIDLHFKVAVGEILSYVFLPLFFYFSIDGRKSNLKMINILLASLSFAALVGSHVFIAFAAACLYLLYIFFSYKVNFSVNFLIRILPVVIGSVASLYVLGAPFLLGKFTALHNAPVSFIPLENPVSLLYSPWRWGFLYQGPNGEIATLIGYTHLAAIGLVIYFLIFKKVQKKYFYSTLFWILIFILFIYLLLPISKPLWEPFDFIKAVGQHRLLIMINFITAIIAGFFILQNKKKRFSIFLIILTIVITVPNWGHRRMIPEINDEILRQGMPLITSQIDPHFYANPKWTDPKNPWFSKIPNNRIEILEGSGQIDEIFRSSTKHTYKVSAKTGLAVSENTLYFPGWSGKIDEKEIPIYPSSKGVVQTKLPQGNYEFSIIYTDVLGYKALKIISAGTLIISVLIITIVHLNNLWKSHSLKREKLQ